MVGREKEEVEQLLCFLLIIIVIPVEENNLIYYQLCYTVIVQFKSWQTCMSNCNVIQKCSFWPMKNVTGS